MNTDNINVSIIVPVYNVECYLEECMESIISQTMTDIEIICVNDGSTDSSPQILEKYALRDSRIKVLSQPNGGYGKAMNTGIKAASGKYIGIVEPDDYIVPDMYEKLFDAAEKNNCRIVKSDFYRFTGSGDTLNTVYNRTARSEENYNRVIDPRTEKSCFRFIMNTWCGIYDREFILKNNIFHNETPGASFQDNGFYFKGFCCADRIMFIPYPLYMNRRDNPNSSVANRAKVYCGNEEYALIYRYLEENPEKKRLFIDVYQMKKLHTYKFNLKRIAPGFRFEYIQKFSEEFNSSKAKGELIKSAFTANEWTELNYIMRCPEEYYYNIECKRIKVTAVVPVYNCEKYLRQCLDSLVNQTLGDIEIILINDGSTDSSGEIIAEYANRDPRITMYDTDNGGAGAARNLGLKKAHGEYIIFLDSDDYFSHEMLSSAYRQACRDNADVTVFRSVQYDNESGNTAPCTYSLRTDRLPKQRPFSVNDMQSSVFRNIMGWAWDKLYKRSFILNNELWFQEQRTTNDMYFTYMSLYKAARITVCDSYLYYQRRNVSGSLSATRDKSWKCFYNALCEMRREMTEMGIYEKYRAHFADYALHSCLWNLNTLKSRQRELFEKLKGSWFDELDISGQPRESFFSNEEYELYRIITEADFDTYISKINEKSDNAAVKKADIRSDDSKNKKTVPQYGDPDYYRYCLEETQNSLSYKIGRAITWLPRKLRGW